MKRTRSRKAAKSPTPPAPAPSRPNAGRFPKGVSGNPAGKKPGTPNRVTVVAREVAAEIVDDPEYRTRLKARALAGELAPAVESMLFHYRFGKPKERVEVSVVDPFEAIEDAVAEANAE